MNASISNRREAGVVDWLIDRLALRLADRTDIRHSPPWEPRANVLLGVLEPIWVQPPPVAKNGDTAAEEAGPESGGETAEQDAAQTGDVPALGLNFRVRAAGREAIELDIDLAFALYLEEIATLDEQRTYLGAAETDLTAGPDATTDTGVDTAISGSNTSSEAATSAADPPSGDPPSTEPTGGEDGAAPATKRPKRERKTRLLGAWRRQDVKVPSARIQVPLDGAVVELESQMDQLVREVVDSHYASPLAMRPLRTKRNELPRTALADEAAFQAAIEEVLDRDWKPTSYLDLELTAFAQPLGADEYLVTVALRNMTRIEGRQQQDLTAYDCQFTVHPTAATPILPQRFDLAPDDYQLADLADVIGHGTGCVAVATPNDGVRTETLPTHIQSVIEPRDDHVAAPRWDQLAADPSAILSSIQVAMEDYEGEFERFVAAAVGQPHHAEAARDLAQFCDEFRRFKLGRRALREDPRLAQAFQLANETFARANAGKPFSTWRLFQLVYIVTHLPALVAREKDDPEYRRELDHVDVLWFPAGGGKTEAYLGLIVTALFYDRLRGKNAGVTTWLRFPLRMLSVQQVFRMLRVLVVAEDLRGEKHIADPDADPFALGYLVGSGGTPNRLGDYPSAWWRGREPEVRLARAGEFATTHEDDRIVTKCPYCGQEQVELDYDEPGVRVVHRCRASGCGRDLPLHITDEEVYRALPSIVISTVDKLTGYSWFPEFTAFSRGPRFRCSEHGYFSVPTAGTCAVGPEQCPPPKRGTHYLAVPPVKDPVPALTVQDEMHLLKEELGAFSGHYEGLIAELQRGGPSGLPSKVLAASATIEQFEDQLRQVYGRIPRAFPSRGFERSRSFYIQTTPDVRRTFVGVLPHYRRKDDVAAIIHAELLRAITELEDSADPLGDLGIAPGLWEQPPSREDVADLLFNYEVALGYVNSKAHGAKLDEELGLLSDALDNEGHGPLDQVVLTGQVPIPELAAAIGRVQDDTLSTDRGSRLRALVGTSVVSHGVDLDRLNMLVMAGMPTTAADYIQVTARSGRTHAGLVVTVYDTFSRRERSLFSNFPSYHTFLDQMVTPVPVNKYAFFVADRTLPGIALALLHDLAREDGLHAPVEGVRQAKHFQRWWNTNRGAIDQRLRDRLQRCYATPVTGVNDAGMEAELATRALARWDDTESKALSIPAREKLTTALFHNQPLANFRDIDEPGEFATWIHSREAFLRLTGQLVDEEERAHPSPPGSTNSAAPRPDLTKESR
ncbi:helicase-related protein [uncultured Serinicoccus sp.]|uniref:helicase-related protein n=1 Tax=uncultured Serinicoccus sp. TaxID=735514 RepID=UPI002614BE74|nr:helicase-related protein [uncultured Serinicoccus sp.]